MPRQVRLGTPPDGTNQSRNSAGSRHWLNGSHLHDDTFGKHNAPVIDVGDGIYGGSRHLGSNLAGTAIVRWFTALQSER